MDLIGYKNFVNLNTSNKGKLAEFQKFFEKYKVKVLSTSIDVAEADADPLTVIVHKVNQISEENVLIEDTSLNVEGADVGINIKWLLDNLPNFIGKKAEWKVLLACRLGNIVYVYSGTVSGEIVERTGSTGFGFDPHFKPFDSKYTLAEFKPDHLNARAIAVANYMSNNEIYAYDVTNWSYEGKMQQ